MNKKFQELKIKFQNLESDLQNPDIVNDPNKLKTVSQEYNELKETVEKIIRLEQIEKNNASHSNKEC